jgi:L-cysteine:1D-myo-inositol 2-amino-2-deoxy-alpha-D-glucopyranoside ligase
MQWLGNVQPDVYPRATDVIPDMISLTENLLRKGRAYEKNGSVYFRVRSYDPFGRLSKLPESEWLPTANRRGNHPDDPNKEDPLDFVLWQAVQSGEPSWPSPWGAGRPGWHIECSVMAIKFLGETVDINGGGRDLVFPHHECSLAQSECATGRTFVRIWMHTGMVRYKNAKMSKSLGNMLFVKDLRGLGANTARICILSNHYAATWSPDHSEKRWSEGFADLLSAVWRSPSGSKTPLDPRPDDRRFHDAMNNNLDTPRALQTMEQLAKHILSDPARDAADAKALLQKACNVLGLAIRYGT